MNHPIKFSQLTFEKADLTKDLYGTRERPSEEKIKQLNDGLYSLGQGTVLQID